MLDGSVHTSLNPLALRLVGNEGAKLSLVLLVEEIEVGLRNIHCVGSLFVGGRLVRWL